MIRLWFIILALIQLITGGCGDADRDGQEMIQIELSGTDLTGSEGTVETNLHAITPSSMIIAISGCKSGFTWVHNTATSGNSVALYRGDRDCVAALRSFIWNDSLWTKEGGGDFFGSGSAPFVSAGNTIKLWVTNPRELPNPAKEDLGVSFSVQQMTEGTETLLLKSGARGTMNSTYGDRVGPFLQWFSAGASSSLLGIFPNTTPEKRPMYRLKYECQGTFNLKPQVNTSTCKVGSTTHSLSDYYFRIVEDTYNGSPTHAQLVSVFGGQNPPTNQPGVVAITNSGQLWGKSGNGTGGVMLDLHADNSVLGCRNYLVVVLYQTSGNLRTNYWSFTWHNLDFATDKTSCSQPFAEPLHSMDVP